MHKEIKNADEIRSVLSLEDTKMSPDLLQSDIMNKIIVEIYNGWPGETGIQRVIQKVKLLSERVPEYAKAMGKTELETLELFAKSRTCNYTNWFQEANFPILSEVYIFDTIDDFKAKFPSKQYQCPNCNGISTNPQVCNSGKEIKGKEICDWKVFGLFGDLGKGIKVIVKDLFTDIPKPTAMFKPIELLEVVS